MATSMRSMWSGAIAFGLVHVPVKMYKATTENDVSFRQVHGADGGRINFRRYCSTCDEEVPYEAIAKGYEMADGEIIVLDDADMADLPRDTLHTMEVQQFCGAAEVPAIYLSGKTYYLAPDPAGKRAYGLLCHALRAGELVALVKVTIRTRERIGMLRLDGNQIILELLHWADEIKEPDFPVLAENAVLATAEMTMARELVKAYTAKFDPEAFTDDYREALAQVVEAKVNDPGSQRATTRQAPAAQPDLESALKASLAARKAPKKKK
jgi:DNA end-binding protein Ku